ncbi:MAG: glycine cleavage system aminomethyltransferase GcvT [Pseudomonadota bacterium]
MSELLRTPLTGLHEALGARMTAFAGYTMPLQFKSGVMAEHLQTRSAAGLFDVSHMGQVLLHHDKGTDAVSQALEALVPADLVGLNPMRQRYGFFTNDEGGLLDDLMIAHRGDHLFVVVNAACKAGDLAHMSAHMPDCAITLVEDRALLALQGPKAETAVTETLPALGQAFQKMRFLDIAILDSAFGDLWVSRSGYTGEDGFEISVPAAGAEAFARTLLDHPDVAPVGLGARDSLRLEAGLCLYGSDIGPRTSPVEAGLTWAIGGARRTGGARAGGFPGADRILTEIAGGAPRTRIGLRPEGRAPMRHGTVIYESETASEAAGEVTSGAFGPTVGAPVSMGYVSAALADVGRTLWGEVRGKRLPATVTALPFTPANFKRGT